MTIYIKDISERRNNISQGEYNRSTIEYLEKLQYFNNFNIDSFVELNDALYVMQHIKFFKVNMCQWCNWNCQKHIVIKIVLWVSPFPLSKKK